jgi:hypothetical protein
MTATNRRRAQLLLAICVLLLSGIGLWFADAAMQSQYQAFRGCWPQKTYFNERTMLTVNFWRETIESRGLGTTAEFFHTRMRHRILLYLMVFCSLVGWSASVFLRIVKSHENAKPPSRKVPGWEFVVSSFFLAVLGSSILFLLLVSTRLMADSNDTACISEGYAYMALVGAIGCGLFVVQFFDWFEKHVTALWDRISGSPAKKEEKK